MTADATRAYADGGDPCPKHRGVGVQSSCPDCDQPYAPADDALARVRAFCEAYPNRRGIDPDTIYGLDGGVFAGGTELRLSDLLALLGAVARVEALCDQREASDRRAQEIEPEDWQANRDHHAARYGGPPELSIDVKRIRAALEAK